MNCLICENKIEHGGKRRLMYLGNLCSDCDKLTDKEVNKVYDYFYHDIGSLFGGKLRKQMMKIEWKGIMKKYKGGNKSCIKLNGGVKLNVSR